MELFVELMKISLIYCVISYLSVNTFNQSFAVFYAYVLSSILTNFDDLILHDVLLNNSISIIFKVANAVSKPVLIIGFVYCASLD